MEWQGARLQCAYGIGARTNEVTTRPVQCVALSSPSTQQHQRWKHHSQQRGSKHIPPVSPRSFAACMPCTHRCCAAVSHPVPHHPSCPLPSPLPPSVAAAFGSGVAFSLVSGAAEGSDPVMNAISTGAAFAVFQGGFYQVSP